MKPKRFNLILGTQKDMWKAQLNQHPKGKYVLYKDFKKLEKLYEDIKFEELEF